MRKPICQYTALSKDVTSHIEIHQKSNEYQLVVKDILLGNEHYMYLNRAYQKLIE